MNLSLKLFLITTFWGVLFLFPTQEFASIHFKNELSKVKQLRCSEAFYFNKMFWDIAMFLHTFNLVVFRVMHYTISSMDLNLPILFSSFPFDLFPLFYLLIYLGSALHIFWETFYLKEVLHIQKSCEDCRKNLQIPYNQFLLLLSVLR